LVSNRGGTRKINFVPAPGSLHTSNFRQVVPRARAIPPKPQWPIRSPRFRTSEPCLFRRLGFSVETDCCCTRPLFRSAACEWLNAFAAPHAQSGRFQCGRLGFNVCAVPSITARNCAASLFPFFATSPSQGCDFLHQPLAAGDRRSWIASRPSTIACSAPSSAVSRV